MPDAPIRQRKFHAFLSHAHADKGVVDGLLTWLNDVSHIPVWYDARNLPTGALIATQLAEAITECRSMIIILSKASVASGWVKEEYNAGVGQRAKFPDFRILPVRIEECDVPGFLETTKWVNLEPGTRDIGVYAQFLSDLYHDDETASADMSRARDVYVSRSWRDTDEAWTADDICRRLVRAKFRLIGDAEDQQGFEEKRVAEILSSCGGLAAILPDRGQGQTSKYLLREISIARAQNLPCLLVAEPTVVLREELADEGYLVKQGKCLVQVDDELLQAQYASVAANYETAKRSLERYESASLSGGVSQLQLDNYRLNLKNAESQLKQLDKQIRLSRIEAPFTGTITFKDVEYGSVVANAPIARVTDLSKLKLEISVPEKEVGLFREGEWANISTDIYPGKIFRGKVLLVADRADAAHNYDVKILIENNNPAGILKAGMYGTVFLEKGISPQALLIPRSALLGSPKNPQVFVVENNAVALRAIQTGASNAESVEVTDGLNGRRNGGHRRPD